MLLQAKIEIDASQGTAEVKCAKLLRSVLAGIEGRTPLSVERLNPCPAKPPKCFPPPEVTPQLAHAGHKRVTMEAASKPAELFSDQPPERKRRLTLHEAKEVFDFRQRRVRALAQLETKLGS